MWTGEMTLGGLEQYVRLVQIFRDCTASFSHLFLVRPTTQLLCAASRLSYPLCWTFTLGGTIG